MSTIKLNKLFFKDEAGIIFETVDDFQPIPLENDEVVSVDMAWQKYITAVTKRDENGEIVCDEFGEEEWEYVPYEGTVTGTYSATAAIKQNRLTLNILTNSTPPVISYNIMANYSNMDRPSPDRIRQLSGFRATKVCDRTNIVRAEHKRKQTNRNKSKLAKVSRRANRK